MESGARQSRNRWLPACHAATAGFAALDQGLGFGARLAILDAQPAWKAGCYPGRAAMAVTPA